MGSGKPRMASRALFRALAVLSIGAVAAATWLLARPRVKQRAAADRLYTLKNSKGMEVTITAIGACITRMMVPDRSGNRADVVLGWSTPDEYATHDPVTYFGAIVGRVANRIANASFTLDGTQYKLLPNNGPNALHGGALGLHKRVWEVSQSNTAEAEAVTLRYDSPAGEEGYPGHLHISVSYRLPSDKNELLVDIRAISDEPTPVNIAQHSYFNLAGHNSGRSILDHIVQIPTGDHFTPVGPTLIPTGEILPVAGTPFDFTSPHTFGERIQQVPGGPPVGYDHNFVLFSQGAQARFITKNGVATLKPKLAATVCEPTSGRCMDVLTTAPGMQLYSGNFLDSTLVGKDKTPYFKHAGFCMETQGFPDSVNQPNFPSVIIKPEEPYFHQVVYKFSNK